MGTVLPFDCLLVIPDICSFCDCDMLTTNNITCTEYYSTRGLSALALVDVRCQAEVMSLIASYAWTP